MEIILENLGIVIFVLLFLAGLIIGTINEKAHYKSIHQREAQYLQQPLISFGKNHQPEFDNYHGELVSASVVVSIDYFKKIVASISNLFGGQIVSYETLLDRARREAILRLKENANGAAYIINARIETSSINQGAKDKVAAVEVLAYGTALHLKQ